MSELTDNEMAVLREVLTDVFFDGADSVLWVDCFVDSAKTNLGVTAQSIGGTLTSLQQKGMIDITIDNDPGRNTKSDNTLSLTPNGAAILNIDA